MEFCVEVAHKHFHKLYIKILCMSAIRNMATVRNLKVTADKFNVFKICANVKYAHK